MECGEPSIELSCIGVGMKVRSLVGLSIHFAFHGCSVQCAARMLMLSDELMSCCAAVQMDVST